MSFLSKKPAEDISEDPDKREKQSSSRFYLRALAAAYLVWLAYKLFSSYLAGESGAGVLVAVVCPALFVAAAAAVLITSYRAWQREKKEIAALRDKQAELEREFEDAAEADDEDDGLESGSDETDETL